VENGVKFAVKPIFTFCPLSLGDAPPAALPPGVTSAASYHAPVPGKDVSY